MFPPFLRRRRSARHRPDPARRNPRGFRAAGVAGRGGLSLSRFLIAVPAALRRKRRRRYGSPTTMCTHGAGADMPSKYPYAPSPSIPKLGHGGTTSSRPVCLSQSV